MFYSTNEISFMSKSHGEEIRRSCGNCRKNENSDKRRSNFRLLRWVSAVFTLILN